MSYAVKCVNRKKLSEEDEAALLDEVSILMEMKNEHIIRLYDFFTEPSTYYLVMEQMSGGELFDRIVAKAYYNEKEARDTCKIILEAVGYMHQNNVAHFIDGTYVNQGLFIIYVWVSHEENFKGCSCRSQD